MVCVEGVRQGVTGGGVRWVRQTGEEGVQDVLAHTTRVNVRVEDPFNVPDDLGSFRVERPVELGWFFVGVVFYSPVLPTVVSETPEKYPPS